MISPLFSSCLTTAPHFKKAAESAASVRKPLSDRNPMTDSVATAGGVVKPVGGATAAHFVEKIQGRG